MSATLNAGYEEEFSTVDMIIGSASVTKNVDGFCLSWIKYEKQLRKLTGNLIYQATVFIERDDAQKDQLRERLRSRQTLMHDHFLGAIRRLTG